MSVLRKPKNEKPVRNRDPLYAHNACSFYTFYHRSLIIEDNSLKNWKYNIEDYSRTNLKSNCLRTYVIQGDIPK